MTDELRGDRRVLDGDPQILLKLGRSLVEALLGDAPQELHAFTSATAAAHNRALQSGRRIGWEQAMETASRLVVLKYGELPVDAKEARLGLEQVLHAIHEAKIRFDRYEVPVRLGRRKRKSLTQAQRKPQTCREAILKMLADGKKVPRHEVEAELVKAGLSSSMGSASNAVKGLLVREEISKSGIRGATYLTLARSG